MARNLYWIEWLKQIDKVKKKYEIPPIDAKVDIDGFLIPGYNGLKINIEKSLNNLDKLGQWNEKCIVLEEVEPYIKTLNLNPAPIRQGNNNKAMVSFMISAYENSELLLAMLDIFKEHKIKSTFFLDGRLIQKYPILARRIRDDGHEMGNQGYSHPDMRGMTMDAIRWEIARTNEIIKKELGLRPKLFTPPLGEYDERVVYLAALERMNVVLNTIDTSDLKKVESENIIHKIKPNLKCGAIILIHPGETSIAALPKLLKAIDSDKYKIGKVSELLAVRRV